MHCRSTCVSSAGPMSLECRSTRAPKHVLLERPLRLLEHIVSRTCTAGAPFATVGALCLQYQSALCNCQSTVAPGMYFQSTL
ncbi:hypothetical protein AMTRI_Chr05g73380 [Amborella trichopoda]